MAVARTIGMEAIEFRSADQVRLDLISLGFPLAAYRSHGPLQAPDASRQAWSLVCRRPPRL